MAIHKGTVNIAEALAIPPDLIPTHVSAAIIDKTGFDYSGKLNLIQSKKAQGTDEEWETEIGALIAGTALKEAKSSIMKLNINPTRLVTPMCSDNRNQVQLAALGMYALLKEGQPLDENTAQSILEAINAAQEKFGSDIFLQLILDLLRGFLEAFFEETASGESFVAPPFQKGLPFFPSHTKQVAIKLKEPITKDGAQALLAMIKKVDDTCREINEKLNKAGPHPAGKLSVNHADFNVGFNPTIWKKICAATEKAVFQPLEKAIDQLKPKNNYAQQSPRLSYTDINMWFFLKGDKMAFCNDMLNVIEDPEWSPYLETPIAVSTASKMNEGRVVGGMFLDGIGSAVDAMSLLREVIVSGIPPEDGQNCEGATFAFTQHYTLDAEALHVLSDPDKEQMIGRDINGETLPKLLETSHVKRARLIREKDGTNTEILRQALPVQIDSEETGSQEKKVHFVAFGKSVGTFFEILRRIYGKPEDSFVKDRLLAHAMGTYGSFLYCPSAVELGLEPMSACELYPPIPFWMEYKSVNPLLFYNHIQYLYTMTTNQYVEKDAPSDRILRLLSTVFARWHSTWFQKFDVPRLPHLDSPEFASKEDIMKQPIQIRKGYSYKVMLGRVFTSPFGLGEGTSDKYDTFRIDPKELIVGVTERLSFGSGKEVMPYLKEDELSLSWSLGLTEAGNMGHIVPDHEIMLSKGVNGLLKTLKSRLQDKKLTPDQKLFLQSAQYAYEGVQLYLLNFASLALRTCLKLDIKSTSAEDRKNLYSNALRLMKLAVYDGEEDLSFHDAAQMIFSMHCCLHLVGQPVSVGRLDQLLFPYYKKDIEDKKLTPEMAQEIIDALFIKFDEHVVLNRYNIPTGHTTYGSTAVSGRGGPFPTGDSLNQWIQQVTVGGYAEDGSEGYNAVTLMCLKACRRLPLNAPCVSLRLTTNPPKDIIEEAAKALLSGGAHPILYKDDQMIQGLHEVIESSYEKLGLKPPPDALKTARNYSCDGCYEPMYTGESEFKFSYVFLLKAVIYALNSGADYQFAGPLHLAGDACSWRTPLARDIQFGKDSKKKHDGFEEFKSIFLKHLRLLVQNMYGGVLDAYGKPWKICPSPMLSCLLAGCLERATDMTNGGSRFHILAPMYVGFANTVNSLYNVKKMVFEWDSITTLEDLLLALQNNWGYNMVEPFYDTTGTGLIHTDMWKQRFLDLREFALELPKFGTDSADAEVNELAVWLAEEMNKITHDVLYEGPLAETYAQVRAKFGDEEHPFVFQVVTGSGTFESYNSIGVSCGATPDGRLSGQPTASDCSPQPFPQDKPVPSIPPERQLDIIQTLKPYRKLSRFIPNGCEVDIRIPEAFPKDSLKEFITAFAKGETGSNLVSITCADNWTFEKAQIQFQQFDLVRTRMGGWSNFFVAMFLSHQKQHIRRPLYIKHEKEPEPHGKKRDE